MIYCKVFLKFFELESSVQGLFCSKDSAISGPQKWWAFSFSKLTNAYEVSLTASYSAPRYIKKVRFSEEILERSEKANIGSSLVVYWSDVLHRSHTPSYLRRLEGWKPTMCQRTVEDVKVMRFPDQPHLSSLQEQLLHEVKTHIPFQEFMLERKTIPSIFPANMTWRKITTRSKSGDQFNPEHISKFYPVNTWHPTKLPNFSQLPIESFKKGQCLSPIVCTKKQHKSPDICRRMEELAHGPIKNISV